MIGVVVVGYGLAGRSIHLPLIRRQGRMQLRGIVARDPNVRAEAMEKEGVDGFASLNEALDKPGVDLVVIATPHDTHADLAIRCLDAGKHCVVDKVMALTTSDADRMIAARDASGRMLGVFHNRRWDWDFLTVQALVASGALGGLKFISSAVCRESPPRSWRGHAATAGTILHDWGAHLVDQALMMGFGHCLRLTASITPAPWPGVDSGGSGRIFMNFADLIYVIQTSRIEPKPHLRWTILGSDAVYLKRGLDPQEMALRAGDLDAAAEPSSETGMMLSTIDSQFTPVPTVRGSWDSYYANVADHLEGWAALAVTAEEAREVVRVLEAAVHSSESGSASINGPWGRFP